MPRIQMTRTVKLTLFVLRIYLILLLALIIIKFLGVFSPNKSSYNPVSSPPPKTSTQNK